MANTIHEPGSTVVHVCVGFVCYYHTGVTAATNTRGSYAATVKAVDETDLVDLDACLGVLDEERKVEQVFHSLGRRE